MSESSFLLYLWLFKYAHNFHIFQTSPLQIPHIELTEIDIHSEMGFNGVEICGSNTTNSIGTMHCGSGFSNPCTIDAIYPNKCSTPSGCDDTDTSITMSCSDGTISTPSISPTTVQPSTSPTTSVSTSNPTTLQPSESSTTQPSISPISSSIIEPSSISPTTSTQTTDSPTDSPQNELTVPVDITTKPSTNGEGSADGTDIPTTSPSAIQQAGNNDNGDTTKSSTLISAIVNDPLSLILAIVCILLVLIACGLGVAVVRNNRIKRVNAQNSNTSNHNPEGQMAEFVKLDHVESVSQPDNPEIPDVDIAQTAIVNNDNSSVASSTNIKPQNLSRAASAAATPMFDVSVPGSAPQSINVGSMPMMISGVVPMMNLDMVNIHPQNMNMNQNHIQQDGMDQDQAQRQNDEDEDEAIWDQGVQVMTPDENVTAGHLITDDGNDNEDLYDDVNDTDNEHSDEGSENMMVGFEMVTTGGNENVNENENQNV